MTKSILVTGGAGFIGSNLTDRLLSSGQRVIGLDNLHRPGTEHNLEWLRQRHSGERFEFVRGDVRDFETVCSMVERSDFIYHLAAQVAVTTSVDDPRQDFNINTLGTFNVLEASRRSAHKPPMIFTSTNKVYGRMDGVRVLERATRYEYENLPYGNPESQALCFNSPYGCSKGAADQYVLDYARIYGLKTAVFRMSCIYGPRQFGNEDQGWLAHFMIAAQSGNSIAIYGDGKQVRDILFVDDLVNAFQLAGEKIDSIAGEVFNIGGGPDNTLSVWYEFGNILAELKGERIPVRYGEWRQGDQRCYVSDIRKAKQRIGWEPQADCQTGIRRLWDWVMTEGSLFESPSAKTRQVAAAM